MKPRSSYNLLVLGLALSASATAMAQGTYNVVRSLKVDTTTNTYDGWGENNPGMLAEGLDGNVYGTTPSGGKLGNGTLITYSPAAGTFTAVSFLAGANGYASNSGVTLGVDGNLYGTTVHGGNTSTYPSGYGTVFSYTPGASAPVGILPFDDSTDGGFPWAPPVQTQDGSLWGVTYNGVPAGVWYKMNPSGSILQQGILPYQTEAPLFIGGDGNLYGTTPYGGSYNRGTVYKLTQAGALTVLYNFNPNNAYEGVYPIGPVIEAADGYLYGTTCSGGMTAGGLAGNVTTGQGTIFKVARNGGWLSTIHYFQDNTNTHEGYCPNAGLVQGSDGMLYGVTANGGGATSNYSGVLFRVNTDGTNFQVLHTFEKTTGYIPDSNLLMDTNGVIYGMTHAGGNSGYGVLYSFDAKQPPFAKLVTPWTGPVGTVINILGQGFTTATSVLIGGVAVPWTKTSHPNVISDTWMQVTVPLGARTGFVTVVETDANGVSTNLVTRETFTLTSATCNPFVMHCL